MLAADPSLNSVTVKKDELIDVIKKNRAKHEAEFEEAKKGFRATVITLSAKLHAEATEGRDIDRIELTNLPEPLSHLKEYDKILRMLEMSVASEISISQHQFEWYVLDEWDWQHHFKAVAATYHGGAVAARRR
jgi:hypothetical protein